MAKLPPVEVLQVKPLVPVAEHCEREVLGALVESAELWAECMHAGLCEADFFFDDHRRIFRTMKSMTDGGEPVDYLTLLDRLGDDSAALLSDLITGAVLVGSYILSHVRILKRKARLRELIHLGEFLQQAAIELGADPEVIAAHAKAKLERGK